MIGRLEKTVVECPDPRLLAEFYCELLGMRINEDGNGWVVIGREPGTRELAFQGVDEWVAPRWRDPAQGGRLHLDIRVQNIEAAQRAVIALGATRAPGSPETGYRVFLDPVGYPFCLVHGHGGA
ncbi:VOC family protein [Promicromonospora sp. Populi]|uniref:VOC family protein n=1 Tax=Promicromonospora sp. Populi TaxID=3239420 RepID=UPI0034E26933